MKEGGPLRPGDSGSLPPDSSGSGGFLNMAPLATGLDSSARRRTSSALLLALVCFGSTLLGATLVVALTTTAKWLGQSASVPESMPIEDVPSRSAPGSAPDEVVQEIRWTDATRAALRMEGMTVRIDQVRYGRVRGRDPGGRVVNSEESFLLVYLEVTNQSAQPQRYISWYANQFTAESGARRVALLADDQNRRYSMMEFTDVTDIQGHTEQADLKPGETAEDLLVFQVPDPQRLYGIEQFRLELPAVAVDRFGAYRFTLPLTMIRR